MSQWDDVDVMCPGLGDNQLVSSVNHAMFLDYQAAEELGRPILAEENEISS